MYSMYSVDCFSLYIIFLLDRLLVLTDCCCFLVVYYIFCRNALFGRLDFFDQTSPEAADIYLQHVVFAANEAAEAVPGWKIWAARFLGFQAARGSTFAEFTIVEVGLVVNLPLSIWFLGGGGFKDFFFSPRTFGGKNPIWLIFFSDGWLNHQLVMAFHYTAWFIDTFNGLLQSSIVQLDSIIPCKALGIFFSKNRVFQNGIPFGGSKPTLST